MDFILPGASDLKPKKEMVNYVACALCKGASSRQIFEVNEKPTAEERGKGWQRDWGLQSGGEGGVGKCSHRRRSDDVDICLVAIFGCYLKRQSNTIAQRASS
jgi:hypothetical protein